MIVESELRIEVNNHKEKKKKPGKGRPFKIYSLKVGFKDIIAQLEKQQKKAVDEGQRKIEGIGEIEILSRFHLNILTMFTGIVNHVTFYEDSELLLQILL